MSSPSVARYRKFAKTFPGKIVLVVVEVMAIGVVVSQALVGVPLAGLAAVEALVTAVSIVVAASAPLVGAALILILLGYLNPDGLAARVVRSAWWALKWMGRKAGDALASARQGAN